MRGTLGTRDQQEKFNRMYAANVRDLMAFAVRRTQAVHEATDVVAETFLIAWRRLKDVPEGSEARLWLFGVARNVLKNSHRTSRRQRRLVEKITAHVESFVTDEPKLADPRVILVRDALSNLKPVEAELIRLNVWEELTPAQIAELMQMPAETVRTHLHRGRLKLRDLIGHEENVDNAKGAE
jgi:RNA polymerase sigma-70 factor (ECF subfamily)